MTDTEQQVIEAWKQAANDLGIRFISPYTVTTSDGHRLEYLGLVHQFGRRVGALICLLQPGVNRISEPFGRDYFISELGAGYAKYVHQDFIDTLNDWQFFGPKSEQPVWYTGKPWGS